MIAASLITKDRAALLARAIDSVRPLVDRTFVYDTGSSDDTVEMLETLDGVNLERGLWHDDFGAARNAALDMVGEDYEWVVWLDDDDVFVGANRLRAYIAEIDESRDGLFLTYVVQSSHEENFTTVRLDHRVFRRARGWRWQGHYSEALSLGREAQMRIVPRELCWVEHRPARLHKSGHYLDLLRRVRASGRLLDEVELLGLGIKLAHAGECAESLEVLTECCERETATTRVAELAHRSRDQVVRGEINSLARCIE